MTIKEVVIWALFLIIIIVGVAVGVAQATGNLEDTFVPALTAALVGVTLYYAIVTNRIARANSESVKIAKDTSLAQIIIQLTSVYAQPEMLVGMNRLREFKDAHGESFANQFTWLKKDDKSQYDELDGDRRRFSHYFHTIFIMLNTDIITVEFLKKLVSPSAMDPIGFLLEVIEPLEKEINPNYDVEMFVRFEEIYQKTASVAR